MGQLERMIWEQEPAALELTDKEILDWLSEHVDQAVYNRPTDHVRGGFTLFCDETTTTKSTLRHAVCVAAAKWQEENAIILEREKS